MGQNIECVCASVFDVLRATLNMIVKSTKQTLPKTDSFRSVNENTRFHRNEREKKQEREREREEDHIHSLALTIQHTKTIREKTKVVQNLDV